MQISQYLDDDFCRIQEYVSKLVEGLPIIGRDSAYDKDLLIRSLVNQNKSYANQIIFLCKTIDTIHNTENSRPTMDSSQSSVNPDFVGRLQDKIREYEHTLDKLSMENERLYFQVQELTQKEERSYQQRQEREYYPMGLIQRSSPLKKSHEISYDIENLLHEGDIEKASEILVQIDYKRPYDITVDRFNSWLVMANKLKDSKLHEVSAKVRNIADLVEAETIHKKGDAYGTKDSIDILSFFSVDKLLVFIEEKLVEVFNSRSPMAESEYRFEDDERSIMRRGAKREAEFEGEQLQTKVRALKQNLSSMEIELQEKHTEVENLKERLTRVKGVHSRHNSLAGREPVIPKDVTKDIDNSDKLRMKLEAELKEAVKERNELNDANEFLKRENREFNQKIQELNDQIYEKDQLISKLVLEGERIKRDHDAQEGRELVQKLKEELAYKEAEISAMSRQIKNLETRTTVIEPKESAKKASLTPTASLDTLVKGSKDSLTLESGLHVQGTLLFNLDKVLKDLKNNFKEILAKSNLSLPQEAEHISVPNDGLNIIRADAHKILKENNSVIQSLLKEAYFIKSASQEVLSSASADNRVNIGDVKSITSKLKREEDKLVDKLTKCLKALSTLRVAVCDTLVSQQITQYNSNKTLTLLQNLYTHTTHLINSFPDISTEIVVLERGSFTNDEDSAAKKLQRLFKDQLAKEQKEISSAIKASLQNINTEENAGGAPRPSINASYEDSQKFSRLFQENCSRMSRIISIFNKGLGKASESISQLARIADTEDAFVQVGDALNEVDALRAYIQELGLINQMEGSKIAAKKITSGRHEGRYETGNRSNYDDNRTKERSFKQRAGRSMLSYEESSEDMNESLLKKLQVLEKKNQEMNSSYDIALKKSKEEWSMEKQKMSFQIERKDQELSKMNQLLDSLQNLSNKQLEVVKDKEEKLSSIMSQKKNEEHLVKDLEKKVEDLTREKSELLAKKSEELEDITKKYSKLKEEYKSLEAKFREANDNSKILQRDQSGIEELKHQMNEKVRKLNELLQVTKNELRNCRQMVQEKNSELMLREEEIQSLRDALKKERNLNKESEFIAHLKQELQSQNTELNQLKKKNGDLIRVNEQLKSEIHMFSQRRDNYLRDMASERMGDHSEDYDTFQKSLRRRDAQYTIDRSHYQTDMRSGRLNTFSGSTRDTDRNDKESKNASTTYIQTEPRHLKGNKTLTSPRDISLVVGSGRDQDVRSITSTMRDLTKSLGISQEPQYKRYHSAKYLSPE